ncbi:MAG: GIY-YIG nuclease family protein [Candidatus Giovannonibacteria bacterium]|nr:GIY-YIG nuclease family protein [Candidatus Giovannonibacteria bacterium]
MFYVYILQSLKDGSYYVGQTKNLERRVLKHNSGASRFTKSRVPYKVVYSESLSDRTTAIKRERQIKSYKGGEAFKKLIEKVRGW